MLEIIWVIIGETSKLCANNTQLVDRYVPTNQDVGNHLKT